jgi:hypothetical protein
VTARSHTVVPLSRLASPRSRTAPRPALGEELENKDLIDLSRFGKCEELDRDNVLDRLERLHPANFDCPNEI